MNLQEIICTKHVQILYLWRTASSAVKILTFVEKNGIGICDETKSQNGPLSKPKIKISTQWYIKKISEPISHLFPRYFWIIMPRSIFQEQSLP